MAVPGVMAPPVLQPRRATCAPISVAAPFASEFVEVDRNMVVRTLSGQYSMPSCTVPAAATLSDAVPNVVVLD